jgi:hypothetical protein
LDFYETLHICSTLPADVHEGIINMVAVQSLKGEIIQLILSRKGGGMYLVSTPTILNFYEILHSCSTQPADMHEGMPLLSKI